MGSLFNMSSWKKIFTSSSLGYSNIMPLCVCMFVCVCKFVCVFACVDLGAFNPPPHVYPSGNGLVPTRSGGCTPRVWAHLASRILRGMLTQPYAPVTNRFQCNQPLVAQFVFPILLGRCHARRVRGSLMVRPVNKGKQIDTYIHKLTYIHTNYTHTSVM